MENSQSNRNRKKQKNHRLLLSILFLYVLVAASYFRFSGLFWGENQYLHPDERFLVWVGSDISPVKNLSEYFNTAESSLNPHNRGHGFYVYGTLPMFLARYVVEGVFGHSGFDEMTQVGRALSSLADLVTVLLVYLVAKRLYDQRVAVLAAAFSAAAVLQIQQSHFFTMDTFITMFSFLAFYFAVLVVTSGTKEASSQEEQIEPDLDEENAYEIRSRSWVKDFFFDPLFLPSLGFGIALGMAVASKLNAAPMALVLPAAMLIHVFAQPPEKRERRALQAIVYLMIAAFVSLLVFRIFQPYAFSGPGFFGVKPNPQWVQNITEQRAQSSRNVDFPPAMQWARRSIWFSFQNMVEWGLGLPLGIVAWAGFLWAGWRLFMDRRNGASSRISHALIWGWTAFYFTWQSLQFNPTMRYELPIYPTLVIFAAWCIVALYDRGKAAIKDYRQESALDDRSHRWVKPAAIVLGGAVLLATYAYAFAFSQIYARPITRVAASRWIYQNIPGPINLPIQTGTGVYNQIVPFPYNLRVSAQLPYSTIFTPKAAGKLSQIFLPDIRDDNPNHETRNLSLQIDSIPPTGSPLAQAKLSADLSPTEDGVGKAITLDLDQTIQLDPGKAYNLTISLSEDQPVSRFDSQVGLFFDASDGNAAPFVQTVQSAQTTIYPYTPLVLDFQAQLDGTLSAVFLANPPGVTNIAEPKFLGANLQYLDQNAETMYSDVTVQADPQARGFYVLLSSPPPVVKGENYRLILTMEPQGGAIALNGLSLANEGEWDDGLPLRMDGNDGFSGIYPVDLNFNMYWDDNPKKLERFTRIMDQADYIAISSNRQWGTLPRIPERFPMTTIYYRNLLGCPSQYSIEYCYRVAVPGKFHGNLGFELVQVFDSNPTIGPLSLNDQFAEEAFTVYDHPKVLIFKKTADYDPQKVENILGAVDFSQVIRLPPLKFESHPATLMLPEGRWAAQQQGGTWSELFNTQALQNRYPALGVLVWYLSVLLLGLVIYPVLHLALPGLADHGYPLARTAGLLVLSYLVWLAGSANIPFTRTTISIVICGLVLFGAWLAYKQRDELRREWRSNRRYYLIVEGVALGFFLAFLLVRMGNPDLWHPWKGGEKPMDFSYFNAVLKSTSFPPYDPWYAGGYLNYYYYGYVLVGVLVKWLGIVPSIAYNLILPTLFCLIALGAFSVAWNLTVKAKASRAKPENEAGPGDSETTGTAYAPAIAAAFGMAVLGNLGTVKMIYQGFQKIAAPGGLIDKGNLFDHLTWAAQGFLKNLSGVRLPYSIGDWYWLPSRIIPAQGEIEPITEFPYFTMLYADLHAHLIALPVTLLALAVIIAIVLGKARWKNMGGGVLWFLLAGLAIGALRPTNTWDLPTYLALGLVGTVYAVWSNYRPDRELVDRRALRERGSWLADINPRLLRLLATVGSAVALAGLSLFLYQPYVKWYALGYTQLDLWAGTHTPVDAYLLHWSLFLFVILPWMAWETRDWLAKTPLSSLRKLRPFLGLIEFCLALLLILTLALQFWRGVHIAWLVLPTAAWAGILILRPDQPDAKRIVLFLVGTSLVLTLMVELIVLHGDIGRMNTVFKFYLQVWTMLAVSAGAALGWLVPAQDDWAPGWRWVWQIGFTLLVAGTALYTMMATMAKIDDRINNQAPHTLDGMAFMPHSQYTDEWGAMDLGQDYQAIRWMQENIKGSPVIVEANLRNLYRWGSRYTIYTGLPGVVGWEWHQQQQRAVNPGSWVTNRIMEIDNFYLTNDFSQAAAFLRKYNVQYIVVGQQERGHYPGPGLDKFVQLNGSLWQEVYRDRDTVIYKVNEANL